MKKIFRALATRFQSLPPADKYVTWVVLVLAAFGVVAVYSSITFFAEMRSGGNTELFLVRHLTRVVLALSAMFVVSMIDYRILARYSRIGLLGALGLLFTVKVMGAFAEGPARWLTLGGFGFQPSDIARVALVLYVGVLLTQKQEYIKSFSRSFLPVLVWVGITVVLVGLEDLSTSAVMVMAVIVMCFIARVSTMQIGVLAMLGLLLGVGLILAEPHRAARVESFIGTNMFASTDAEYVLDRQGEGYQADQARIAFAMGGLTGVGPGKSVQRDFLPTPYNDFIFAIIAEEYGLLGALALLGAFCLLLFRGFLRIARDAPDPLGAFLATGFTTLIALYGFIHAGVSCGLLPVTGLPMPFVSYGGTSMIANGIMAGILLNISRQTNASKENT
ncbi:MAG: putative peptidoglycan glycosyltransferase FtsW [Longimonas sp.]|uniref:FtsW/RodA/SpoVE family cell cycle protein n=1 Tax=Longimonas sp. TaxID=2039626 RepID=UPI003347FD0F